MFARQDAEAADPGQPQRVLLRAGPRDRASSCTGKAFSRQTWAKGLDDQGHPIVMPGTDPTPEGNYTCPDANGATNWAAPSYDPKTNLFIIAVREACAVYTSKTNEPRRRRLHRHGPAGRRGVGAPGAIRALDPATGDTRWNFPIQEGSPSAGVLATAGGVVFASSKDGYLIALDARTASPLAVSDRRRHPEFADVLQRGWKAVRRHRVELHVDHFRTALK